jgi:hypothetical protein
MDILAALRQEEAKFEKQVNIAQQQLDTVRAVIKLLGSMNRSSGKVAGSSGGKTTGGKKRVMSAAARAKISKASKERWANLEQRRRRGNSRSNSNPDNAVASAVSNIFKRKPF